MAGKSPASPQNLASGKTAPTLTPTGKFSGKPEVPLSRTVTLIGSGAAARLQLISSTVSKSHALVVNCDCGPYVRDLASRTKVVVNGQAAREAVLKQGDAVQFGKFAFTFNKPKGSEKTAKEAPPPGQVQVTGVDSPIPLGEKCLLVGRRESCDIVIADDAVSTAHAVIFEMDGRRFVRDLGSRTGTFVNDSQVHQAELEFGDTIRIGQVELKYESGQQPMEQVSLEAEPEPVEPLVPILNEAGIAEPARESAEVHAEEATAPPELEELPSSAQAAEVHEPSASEQSEAAPLETDAADADQIELEPIELEPADAQSPNEEHSLAADDISAEETGIDMSPPQPRAGDEAAPVDAQALESPADQPIELEPLAVEEPAEPAQETPEEITPLESEKVSHTQEIESAVPIELEPASPAESEEEDHTAKIEAAAPIELEPAPADQPEDFDSLADEPETPHLQDITGDEQTESPDEAGNDSGEIAIDEPGENSAHEESAPEAGESEAQEGKTSVFETDSPDAPSEIDLAALEAEAGEQAEELAFDLLDEPSRSGGQAEQAEEETPELDISSEPLDEPLSFTPPSSQVAPLDLGSVSTGEAPLPLDPAAESSQEQEELGLDLDSLDDAAPDSSTSIEPPALDLGPEPPTEIETETETETPFGALEAELDPPGEANPPEQPPPGRSRRRKRENAGPSDVHKPAKTRRRRRRREKNAPAEGVAPPSASANPGPPQPPSAPPPSDEVSIDQSALAQQQHSAFGDEILLEPGGEPSAAAVEVIAETEPAPSVAMEIGQELTDVEISSDSVSAMEVEPELTDTRFSRAVEDFTQDATTGPLVEHENGEHPLAELTPEPPLDAFVDSSTPESQSTGEALEELARSLDLPEPATPAAKIELIGEEVEPSDQIGADLLEGLLADEPPPIDIEATEPEIQFTEPQIKQARENLAQTEIPDATDASEQADQASAPPVPRDETPAEPLAPPAEAPPAGIESPAEPPSAPRPSWGANQEHFLGGLPLQLGGISPAPAPLIANPPPAIGRPMPAQAPAPAGPATRAGSAAPKRPPAKSSKPSFAGGMGLVSPPVKGPAPRQIVTGFDGLASPDQPGRQVDIFSQMPVPAADDPFANSGATDALAKAADPGAPPPADRGPSADVEAAHPQTAPHSEPPSAPDTSAALPPMTQSEAQEPEAREPEAAPPPAPPPPSKRKRRWFGLKLLLVLMVLSAGATAAGMWYLLPSRVQVTGRLRFDNYTQLTRLNRQRLDSAQQALLASAQVRNEAKAILMARDPGETPGFLDSPSEFGKVAAAAKLDPDSGVLTVRYVGSDPQGGQARMLALMTALYDANRGLTDQSAALRDEIGHLQASQKRKQQELTKIKTQLDRCRQAAQARPDAGEMTRLKSEATRLAGENNESAQAAYAAAREKLADARHRVQAADDAAAQRDRLSRIYSDRGKELEQITSQLEMKRRLAETRPVPMQPTSEDVTVIKQTTPRERLHYTFAGTGAMMAVFAVLIALNATGGRRRSWAPPARLAADAAPATGADHG